MMGIRRPRKMKNRIARSGPRRKLYPMVATEKVGKLKEAIRRIEEAQKAK